MGSILLMANWAHPVHQFLCVSLEDPVTGAYRLLALAAILSSSIFGLKSLRRLERERQSPRQG